MGSVALPENFRYTKEGPLYQLRCGDAILADMSRVAIAFAVAQDGSTVRHKHGTEDSVLQWFRWAKARYEACGLQWIADELCFLVSDSWDLDELNKIMADGAYLATYLRGVGIDPAELRGGDGLSGSGCADRPSREEVPALPV